MPAFRYQSSRPDEWILPRPHRDAHQRYQTYGPIQPMEEPSFWEKLLNLLH